MLRGSIAVANPKGLAGWAQDNSSPDAALDLLITNNGVETGSVSADIFRADLLRAGIGNGHHAFDFRFPPGAISTESHIIRILEKSSGAELPGSPVTLKASQSFKSVAEAFIGSLDSVSPEKIAGWARDELRPEVPVTLLIFDNEELVSRVVANVYREELKTAGLGNGCHGFEFAASLDPNKVHVVQVRRAIGNVEIPGSPITLRPPSRSEDRTANVLRGAIDVCDARKVSGWVRDRLRPDVPVSLLITKNDEFCGRLLANGYRRDLEAAGMGNGRLAFEFTFPQPLSPLETHVIRVMSEIDGSEMPGSPRTIAASRSFSAELQKSLAWTLDQCGAPEDISAKIEFLVNQMDRLLQQNADTESTRVDRANYRHLLQRWKSQPGEAISAPGVAPGSALRALVIDERLPKPDRDAGSNAILSHIRSLQRLGYGVTIVPSIDFNPAAADRAAIEAAGISCCCAPYYGSVEEVLKRQAGEFDLVYLHRISNASKYGELVFTHFPKARRIYSVADLHHLRLLRQSKVEDRPELAALGKRLQLAELTAAAFSNAVITHSKNETDLLKASLPGAAVFTVPWSVKLRPTKVPFSQRSGFAFIGSFRHLPNQDAVRWLIKDIVPMVRSRDPSIQCFLVGSDMPEQFKQFEAEGIVPIGYVEDLSAIFDRVRLTVAPLAYGAGIKGKVIDSLSAGIPCVCTNIAAEGLNLPALLGACVADDSEAFAASIVRLHDSESENERCGRAGLEFVDVGFSDSRLDALMSEVAGRVAKKPEGNIVTAASGRPPGESPS